MSSNSISGAALISFTLKVTLCSYALGYTDNFWIWFTHFHLFFFSFGFLTPRKINCPLSKLASLYKLVSFFFEKATKIHSVVHCRESEFFHKKKDSLLKSVGFSFRKNGNRDSFDDSFVNNNFWKNWLIKPNKFLFSIKFRSRVIIWEWFILCCKNLPDWTKLVSFLSKKAVRFHLIVQSLKYGWFLLRKEINFFDEIAAFVFEIKMPTTVKKCKMKTN